MEKLSFTTRSEWRCWLRKNHCNSTGIWIIFHKKHTGKPTLDYADFVEEALCFGWIDSLVKRLDEERYIRKVTPRRPGSVWSDLNKRRVANMEKSGLMTAAGNNAVHIAKKNGSWEKSDKPVVHAEMNKEFENALQDNPDAEANFNKLSSSHRGRYLIWIQLAKRPETKTRRIHEAIELLQKGRPLGLK